MIRTIFVLLGVVLLAATASAQDTPPDTVTYDEVNDVAARMYCPICEMEPLHTCRAQTCIDWREEIRDQLADGRSEEQIINYFVSSYGERVVGIPEDNGLRLFSLAGPIAVSLLALGIGVYTFRRWQADNATYAPQPIIETTNDGGDDDYRSRLENDLRA
jgi:cytochrome c-type biogenesis protein CcmH